MIDQKKVLKGLEMCLIRMCDECPYDDEKHCSTALNAEARDLIKEYWEDGKA